MRSLFLSITILALLPAAFMHPFLGVMLWSWISFMSPHRLTWGIGDTIPFALIVGLAGIAGWMASERRRLPLDATTVLIALFTLSLTVSTYFALWPEEAWPKWWLTVKAFIYLFVTAALLTNRIRVHALLWVMVISISYFGIKGGIFTLATGGNFRIFGPPDSVISDNNHIALALVVTLPLMNYLGRQSRQQFLRYGSRIGMALCVMSILSSYSRGAFIGLAAMFAFLWRHSKSKLVSAVVLGALMAGSISFMPTQWLDRMRSIETYDSDASAEGRLVIWKAATLIAVARPLVGGGFKAPYNPEIVAKYSPGAQARAVHSIYFEVIGENGFLAFAIWLAIAFVALRNCAFVVRHTKGRPEMQWANDLARMSTVSLVGYFVGGAFLSLPYWDFYFTMVVIMAAVRRITVAELGLDKKTAGALYGRFGGAGLPQPGYAMKQAE
jgi:putative inorganic carbon (HCO3(-)) transporter